MRGKSENKPHGLCRRNMKISEQLPFVKTWMNLKNLMLRDDIIPACQSGY
jgi:hypothetical protein